MKNYLAKAFLVLLLTASLMTSAAAEEVAQAQKDNFVTGSASAGVFNRYAFRGYELSDNSAAIQPSISVNYKGFGASMWGNIDTEEHPTQSFIPDRMGEKSFNEIDLTLSYTYNLDKLSLSGGYIYYGTKYANETEELFISVSYDTFLKPTIAVYRDINEYPGTYVNLSASKSVSLYKEITLDFGASTGYFAGSADYWKTYETSTGAYTGKKYRALHDGMIKAGLSIPVGGKLLIQPMVQYWFPLSDKSQKTESSVSYNFNGKLDDTLVAGLNLTLSF